MSISKVKQNVDTGRNGSAVVKPQNTTINNNSVYERVKDTNVDSTISSFNYLNNRFFDNSDNNAEYDAYSYTNSISLKPLPFQRYINDAAYNTTGIITANTVYFLPFYIYKSFYVRERLALTAVTTAAGGTINKPYCQFAIYKASKTDAIFYEDTPRATQEVVRGDIRVGTGGVSSISESGVYFQKGLYLGVYLFGSGDFFTSAVRSYKTLQGFTNIQGAYSTSIPHSIPTDIFSVNDLITNADDIYEIAGLRNNINFIHISQ